MVVLVGLMVGGGVTNAIAMRRMHSVSLAVRRKRNRNYNFFLASLVLSNLLILFVYCPIEALWLVTYDWPLPLAPWSCKAAKYFFLFAFCFHANIVACIAIDRAQFTFKLISPQSKRNLSHVLHKHDTRHYVFYAGLLASVCSVPQLVVIETITIVEPNSTFTQCLNIFEKAKYINLSTEAHRTADYANLSGNTIYQLGHLAVVSLLPLVVIITCYSSLLITFCTYARQSFTTVAEISTKLPPSVCSDRDLFLSHDTFANTTGHRQPLQCDQTGIYEMRERAATIDATVGREGLTPPLLRLTVSASTVANPVDMTVQFTPFIPAWRRELVGRATKTACHISACYSFFWLPYSIVIVVGLVDESLRRDFLDKHANWMTKLTVMNSVVAPFLYRFGDTLT